MFSATIFGHLGKNLLESTTLVVTALAPKAQVFIEGCQTIVLSSPTFPLIWNLTPCSYGRLEYEYLQQIMLLFDVFVVRLVSFADAIESVPFYSFFSGSYRTTRTYDII